MALNICEIIRQFKADVAQALSGKIIEHICDYLCHPWRDRVLNPVTTVHVFLLQILHGIPPAPRYRALRACRLPPPIVMRERACLWLCFKTCYSASATRCTRKSSTPAIGTDIAPGP